MQKWKSLKLTAAATIILAAQQSYAIGNGFYIGLMAGPATNGGGVEQAQVDKPNIIQLTPVTPETRQFGGRLFLGNQFNAYAAFEFGLDFFSTINYDTHDVETLDGSPSVNVFALDLGLKGILPFYYFNVFGKIGAAAAYVKTSEAFNAELKDGNVVGTSKNEAKFSAMYGIGASYDINQSWVVDLSYTVLQVGGSISNVSLAALGLSYHFTDKYCGQFLCDG